MELMHLSFALLSSTGMGDVLPMSGPARGIAAVEMFAGVMYLGRRRFAPNRTDLARLSAGEGLTEQDCAHTHPANPQRLALNNGPL